MIVTVDFDEYLSHAWANKSSSNFKVSDVFLKRSLHKEMHRIEGEAQSFCLDDMINTDYYTHPRDTFYAMKNDETNGKGPDPLHYEQIHETSGNTHPEVLPQRSRRTKLRQRNCATFFDLDEDGYESAASLGPAIDDSPSVSRYRYGREERLTTSEDFAAEKPKARKGRKPKNSETLLSSKRKREDDIQELGDASIGSFLAQFE